MKNVPWKNTLVQLPVMLALLLAATGCLQLELAIEMHEKDAGATITERLRFSELLLDLDRASGLARHLGRAGAQARMKQMGQGMELVSHDQKKLQDGSRESVSVYRIPDIDDLRLPNPFVQNNPPAPMLRFRFNPVYKRVHSRDRVGDIHLSMVRAGTTGSAEPDDAGVIPAETPLDLQLYRDLQPVFANLMSDFEVKVTLMIPNQPGGRGRQSGDRTITLLHFNDKHMDRHAELFLHNEEAMLAMLQFNLNDAPITDHTKEFIRNRQVPVHRGRSNWQSTSFVIRPTTHLYGKYFAGRPKSEGGDQ